MKILFIGVGLTHYGNQILNRLHDQPNIEIFDLVDARGVGHVAPAVHQTDQGVRFHVIQASQNIRNKWSDFPSYFFPDLPNVLERIRPDIIVASQKYMEDLLFGASTQTAIRTRGIKLILKDIPFRLERYEKVEKDIEAGVYDRTYRPWYVRYLRNALKRVGLKRLASYTGKLVTRHAAQSRMRQHLERRRKMFNAVDAHVNYVEDAFDLFGSYGVPREKIFITYNSPDTDMLFEVRARIEQEAPILPPNPHRIIHVGRLAKEKRVDLLVEALKELRPEFPDVELVVIGYGPQEQVLKQLTREQELQSSVQFVGGVYDPETLGKYLLASTVYVLAGMGGISINDAMAFGKPVICSVCDGTEKKLVREGFNGFFFQEGNAHDLAAKIRTLFMNPELVRVMGEHSTDIIRNEINIHTVVHGYLAAFRFVSETKV